MDTNYRSQFRYRLPVRRRVGRTGVQPAPRQQRRTPVERNCRSVGPTIRRGDPAALHGSGTSDAADRLYATCQDWNIRIDLLINNAGMYRFGETLDIERDFTAKMIALHVLTPTKLCLLFGKDMRRQRHGYILNMSSVTAWLAYPGINVYGATKCYLKHFSRGLHTELRDYGVNVTAVCPGAVDTDLYNLNGKRRRLLVRLGIMLPPEKLARRAIHALFRGKAVLVPGLLNRLVLALTPLIPHSVIRRVARRTNILPLHE